MLPQWLWKMPCYLEEFSKRNIVQAIWAVEHHTLFSNSFGQILCCLCLACPCWTLWGTSQVQLKSSKKSPTKKPSVSIHMIDPLALTYNPTHATEEIIRIKHTCSLSRLPVASVCKRGDNQASRVSKIFVTISKLSTNHSCHHVLLLNTV